MFETAPSPIKRDKEAVNAQTGEKRGWENRWSEAQLYLFHDDFKKTLEQAGFTVREWQEGDPKGNANGKPEEIATQSCGDNEEVLVAYAAREPNNSNVQFYFLQDGEVAAGGGNHDMTASEFLDNLRYSLDQHGISLLEQFDSSEEVGRMKNWTSYDEMKV